MKLILRVLGCFFILSSFVAKSSLLHLSENDFFHVSTFLRVKDGIRAAQVCQSWHKIWNDPVIWREYVSRIPGYKKNEENLKPGHLLYSDFQSLMNPQFNLVHIFLKSQALDFGKVDKNCDILKNVSYKTNENSFFIKFLKMASEAHCIIGTANNRKENKAFIWTEQAGLHFLGSLNGGQNSFVQAVSADGKTVVGSAEDGNQNNLEIAFIWRREKGMTSLGTLEGQASCAYDISADGQVVAGVVHQNNIARAFKWTETEGVRLLDSIKRERNSYAQTISIDGKVIAGMVEQEEEDENSDYETQAFKWSEKNGFQILKNLDEGHYGSIHFLNADGTIALGMAEQDETNRAARWEAEDIQSLKSLKGKRDAEPLAMSKDNKVIIGMAHDDPDDENKKLFLWMDQVEPISFDVLFQDIGFNYDRSIQSIYTLNSLSINADGTQIVGSHTSDHHHFINADGTQVVGSYTSSRSIWSWQAYLPRYDVFKREGIDLIKKIEINL